MAKANRKQKAQEQPEVNVLQAALQQALDAPATVKAAPVVNMQPQPDLQAVNVFVVVGGTSSKPVLTDAKVHPAITAEQLKKYGASRKDVTQGLSLNLMAGTKLESSILNRDNDLWAERSLRTDKAAFFHLTESEGGSKMFCTAWALDIAERKRYDAPTLQTLWRAVRRYKVAGGEMEARLSPMEKFARALLEVIDNPDMQSGAKIASLRQSVFAKANIEGVVIPIAKQA